MLRVLHIVTISLVGIFSLTAQVVTSPFRTSTMDPEIRTLVVPKWENGSLLAFSVNPPRVYASDDAGHLRFRIEISPPGAERVELTDMSAAPNGKFAVAGTGYGAGGAYAQFLAWLAPDGRVEKFVNVENAGIVAICFGPDNSLWTLVREFGSSVDFKEAKNYDLIRRYDDNGKLTGTMLPRDLFPAR